MANVINKYTKPPLVFIKNLSLGSGGSGTVTYTSTEIQNFISTHAPGCTFDFCVPCPSICNWSIPSKVEWASVNSAAGITELGDKVAYISNGTTGGYVIHEVALMIFVK